MIELGAGGATSDYIKTDEEQEQVSTYEMISSNQQKASNDPQYLRN